MCDANEKVGLEHVSDEALASIVEEEIAGEGELKSYAAKAAFCELSKRSEK